MTEDMFFILDRKQVLSLVLFLDKERVLSLVLNLVRRHVFWYITYLAFYLQTIM